MSNRVGAAHDHQRLSLGRFAPLLVVPGDVTEQGTPWTHVRPAVLVVMHEGQQRRQQAARGRGDEIGGAVMGEQLAHGRVVECGVYVVSAR